MRPGRGDLALTFNVSVLGKAGEGKPDYLAEPQSAAEGQSTDESSEDGGFGAVWIAGLAAVALALVVALLIRARRRSAQS